MVTRWIIRLDKLSFDTFVVVHLIVCAVFTDISDYFSTNNRLAIHNIPLTVNWYTANS